MFEDAEKIVKSGKTTYWKDGVMIGRKCSKCGEDKPISEFGIANKKKNQYRADCKKCHAKATREYEINNPEKKKEYYENNAEKIKEYSREYYRKNWECYREHNRQWVRNNPEKNRAKSRKWTRENPEYEKEYHERLRVENIQKITNMLHQTNPALKEKDVKAYGYIYRVTGPNNHFYIGQTVLPLIDRYRCGIKSWIKERIEKDKPKFVDELANEEDFTIDIIDVGCCKYHLDKLEVHYIDEYNSYNNGYNNISGNYKTNDGIEEFNKILEENGLKFIDGKLIEK